jgi:predicted PurR-regulated permease PerM
MQPGPAATEDAAFRRRVAWLLLTLVLLALAIALAPMLLLIFASVLVAIGFDALARPIERLLRLPHRWALLIAVLLVLALLGLAFAFLGAELQRQVAELREALPRAWQRVEEWLGERDLGARLLEALRNWSPSGAGVARNVGNLAAGTVGAIGAVLLVVVAGVYLAAQPGTYRSGLLQLLPARLRERGDAALALGGSALRSWLRAQLLVMVVVSVLTTLGLWLIGVPAALALGLLAGLAEFVPVLGPVIAAVPALLLAASLGLDTLLWTLGLYLAIQQIEGNLLMPWVTQRAVELPPALVLFALFAFGSLLGPLGLLLGAPLAVVGFVLVRELCVEPDAAGAVAALPGQTGR